MTETSPELADRRALLDTLLVDRPDDLLVVSSLGTTTWDLSSLGNHVNNFCFVGTMGVTTSFAFGLALATPKKRVLLLVGDGDLLMGLGTLATISGSAPTNLAILVLDNGVYRETGSQPTATGGHRNGRPATDLAAVADACGIENAVAVGPATALTDQSIDTLRVDLRSTPGPVVRTVGVTAEKLPMAFPYSFDGVTAINRFRSAVIS